MADMHILTRSGTMHRIAAHVAVANTNNAAGVNYRTALVNAKLATLSALPDGDGTAGTISSAEKTSLASGALVEIVRDLDVTQGGALTTGAQINAYLDAWYIALTAEVQGDLQARLSQFGRTR